MQSRSSKHIPLRCRQYKGCFGKSPLERLSLDTPREVVFEGNMTMDDDVWMRNKENFEKALTYPETILNMRDVTGVDVNCALLLKAFFDEYFLVNWKKPKIRSPKNQKVRAIFNYLELSNYSDAKRLRYKDIDCWQIKSWEQDSKPAMSFAQLLLDEIIPKCWAGTHSMSQHSSSIASSVSEALWNSVEHAYTGKKKDSKFRKLYLGVGEYPDTGLFSFCIYDKGIGIIRRMKDNPEGWFTQLTDFAVTDSKMIEKATQGRSGAIRDKKDGRGQGLKTAIELLNSNQGKLDIMSDHGYFSTYDQNSGKDRKAALEGTMVAFSFPIEYI